MGLGGFIIGGALAGAGKAMQLQQEDDVVARREARLAALRAEERKEDRANQVADQQTEITATANRDRRLFNYDTIKGDRAFERESELASAGAAAETADREDRQAFELALTERKLGFEADQASKDRAFKASQELGNPIGQSTDEKTGEPVLIFRDPKAKSGVRSVRITGVDERKPEKVEGGSTLLSQTGGAPKATATTPPATSGGGMLTDAQAEAFANNPANKGKSFIGPDGKRYVVQ